MSKKPTDPFAFEPVRVCDAVKYLCTLPNGAPLKYAQYYRKGSQAKWSEVQDIDIKDSSQKKDLYKLDLWSSGTNQHVVAADFDDKMPEGFSKDEKGYDDLFEKLSWICPNAVVTRSRRQRVKLFFVIKLPDAEPITMPIALATLENLLEPKFYEVIDKKSGPKVTVLTKEMKRRLQNQLHRLKPEDAVIPPRKLEPRPLREMYGPIPAFIERFFSGGRGSRSRHGREKFLRILLATPQLRESWAISTPKMSKECGVSEKAISNWRRSLIGGGVLELLDKQFFKGKLAQLFRAAGELLEHLPPLPEPGQVTNISSKSKMPPPHPPPSEVEDGHWCEEMLNTCRWFKGNDDLIWDWFFSVPTHADKDEREREMRGWIASYHRFHEKHGYKCAS